jgi:CRISPR-associated protein Csb1
MSQETKPTPEQVQAVNKHLDALLGVDVRKPGTAAKLPAVIKITETLEPAGGTGFPVFPPSYAGENTGDPPLYDLNGIDWGHRETTLSNGAKKTTPYIKSARHCTMDSPQSHANLTEIAFSKDERLRALVPKVSASYPRDKKYVGPSGIEEVDVLTLPHRVADFRVRASREAERADVAIKAFAKGNALPLLQLMPTSILFGFWDSRAEGYQHKHSRILLTRIDAFNVVPCERHALYNGPYSKDECATVVLRDEVLVNELSQSPSKMTDRAKQWDKAMAERGFTNALSKPNTPGGIFVERIERLALVSLTDIASIFCAAPQEQTAEGQESQDASKERSKTFTNAARRYLLALVLLAENYPRSTGSYRLRSGCELIAMSKKIELRGAGAGSDEAKALLSLCENPDLLIAVAEDAARNVLGIETSLPAFQSDADSLRSYLGKELKSEKDAAREKKALESAAKKAKSDADKARTKANKANEAATAAEEKAKSGNDKDKATAERKRQEAVELSAKADELDKSATEAASKLSVEVAKPVEPPATGPADSSPEPQPTTTEA